MATAVLFKSDERFMSFRRMIERYGINCTILDFSRHEWIEYDYSRTDFVIYYPSFRYSSNYPLAVYEVHDNLMHIKSRYPNVKMYPDPGIISFYNDKYKQYLFLKCNNYPMPLTYPLVSEESVRVADKELGYPMVIKNRYGAGGGSVFKIVNKQELRKY